MRAVSSGARPRSDTQLAAARGPRRRPLRGDQAGVGRPHAVVGASGLDAAQLEDLSRRTGTAHCLVVPNFAIGAVLMMRLAEQVAAHLPEAEIIEAHHAGKADAPSGTALRTAARIAAASIGKCVQPSTSVST